MNDPMPLTSPPHQAISWRACARGALVGLAIIVPTTIVRAILDREIDSFDDSGWIYPLFVLILLGYLAAGWVAGRARADSPLTHGAIAGLGVLVAWVPIRIVIWAVREDDRGLFSGQHAALPPRQVFGHLVIAAGLGMLGGLVGGRPGAAGTDAPSPEPDPIT